MLTMQLHCPALCKGSMNGYLTTCGQKNISSYTIKYLRLKNDQTFHFLPSTQWEILTFSTLASFYRIVHWREQNICETSIYMKKKKYWIVLLLRCLSYYCHGNCSRSNKVNAVKSTVSFLLKNVCEWKRAFVNVRDMSLLCCVMFAIVRNCNLRVLGSLCPSSGIVRPVSNQIMILNLFHTRSMEVYLPAITIL